MHEVRLEFESEMELLEWAKDRSNGTAASLVIWELNNWLRGIVKHTEEKDWPDAEKIREHLWEVCNEYDYNMNL